MTKRLFHLIPDAEWDAMKASDMTWAEVRSKYRQPPWCGYTGALYGSAGCWSLVARLIKGRDDCKSCDANNSERAPNETDSGI